MSDQDAQHIANILSQLINIVSICDSEPLVKQYLSDLDSLFVSQFNEKYEKVGIDTEIVLETLQKLEGF
jgi:hypothetical protein